MNPQNHPPRMPPRSPRGTKIGQGRFSPCRAKAVPVMPMAPAYICPSTPMLKCPPLIPKATASEARSRGQNLFKVCANPPHVPSEERRTVPNATNTSPPKATMKMAPHARASIAAVE